MYNVSIIMPAIRTPRWDSLYDSIQSSCKKNTFELILCGPFELTEKLSKLPNVKHIKDYGSPSRCAQIAAKNASGKLLAHSVDDAIFIEDSLDLAIEDYSQKCTKKDVINLRYTEGLNHNGEEMPIDYWRAWHHPTLRLSSIPEHYRLAIHHLVDREYFIEIGGYDCQYEYQNFNLHDFAFRIQHLGGNIFDSSVRITNCDFYPQGMVDHKAIEEAFNMNDYPLFLKMYSTSNALEIRTQEVKFDNFLKTSPIWNRRFKKDLPETYEDIVKNN